MTAEIIELHEYYTTCGSCGETIWHIQWNQRCTGVLRIICAACTHIIENPIFDKQQEIIFEPDFDGKLETETE